MQNDISPFYWARAVIANSVVLFLIIYEGEVKVCNFFSLLKAFLSLYLAVSSQYCVPCCPLPGPYLVQLAVIVRQLGGIS